jgi:hypothetical protein
MKYLGSKNRCRPIRGADNADGRGVFQVEAQQRSK